MSKFSEELAREIRQLAGIDPTRLMEIGLIDPQNARKWVVKQKYYALAKTGRTYTDIKYELSEQYGLSISTIEKIIYRRQCEPMTLGKTG